jgi:hypothetical protein
MTMPSWDNENRVKTYTKSDVMLRLRKLVTYSILSDKNDDDEDRMKK